MSRSERIAQQLGMSYGAARGRLNKALLFRLVERLNENVCFVCEQKIQSVNEFSIEHKQPWEGRDALLFWDLDNIAFSHIECNRPHRFYEGNPNLGSLSPHTKAKEAPDGLAWCAGHKDYLLVEAFHSNQRNVSGVASYCRECRKTRLD